MAAVSQLKVSDKQSICKKLVAVLKKRYKGSMPKNSRPTLETLLYATCLEDASVEEADERFERLTGEFHDLNEVRVSSITELIPIFEGLSEPEQRAMRVRSTLQYVFEKHFEFDFEAIRRKTLEAAERQLGQIKGLSPFVKLFALQSALGSHVVPIDRSMCDAAIWLGLVEPDATPETAAESLKPVLRKSDAPQFCHLLRQLATDPKLQKVFSTAAERAPEEGYDAGSAPERLTQLFKKPTASRKRSTGKKTSAKKKTGAKKSTATTTRKKKPASTTRKKSAARSGTKTTKKKKPKKKSRASSR